MLWMCIHEHSLHCIQKKYYVRITWNESTKLMASNTYVLLTGIIVSTVYLYIIYICLIYIYNVHIYMHNMYIYIYIYII